MKRLSTLMMAFLSLVITYASVSPALYAATPQAEAYYAQAMAAYEQKGFLQAASLFQKATEADNTYIDAWFNLGAVQYRLNKFEEARNAFQKALWRSPNDNEIRYNLGAALAKLGRNTEALEQFNKIPSGHPKYNEALNQIASIKSTTVATKPKWTKPTQVAKTTKTNVNAVAVSGTGLYAKGLVGPTGIAVGPNGELYVANYTKNNIVKILPNGNQSTLIQGGLINGPIGLVRDPRNGNLYVANYISGDVVSITPSGTVSTLKKGYGKPYYLYFDALTNRLFVSEQEGNQVSVIKL
ncbi:MAG: tetratricopeptide repeat protein [Vampirovibrionales bacterium]